MTRRRPTGTTCPKTRPSGEERRPPRTRERERGEPRAAAAERSNLPQPVLLLQLMVRRMKKNAAQKHWGTETQGKQQAPWGRAGLSMIGEINAFLKRCGAHSPPRVRDCSAVGASRSKAQSPASSSAFMRVKSSGKNLPRRQGAVVRAGEGEGLRAHAAGGRLWSEPLAVGQCMQRAGDTAARVRPNHANTCVYPSCRGETSSPLPAGGWGGVGARTVSALPAVCAGGGRGGGLRGWGRWSRT